MKPMIHPLMNTVQITCTCGNTINTKSTVTNNKVEICSNCHPFYTGSNKTIDTDGQVAKFNKRYSKTTI